MFHYQYQSQPKIEINIKMLNTYEDFTIEVNPSGTVGDIKIRIQEMKGIPVEKQKVYFAGKPRVNERYFKDCGIQVGSYVSIAVDEPEIRSPVTWRQKSKGTEVMPEFSDARLEVSPTCEPENGEQDIDKMEPAPAPSN
ncbi:hypothetical protein BDZ94DRAFT_1253097 [Collybia nuda]|uniref:Ubiquitin-like domain-containing protein n=1 Tax=Collybia nuda TaxID=64659 RepID=A0A9P5YBR8_9AGAR|nr:hypothetical protein BDZ94DRAFT_1253097 [Collybia nuda]